MKRPSFLVIGAPKCGTTSLFHYLAQHPDVYLPARKELHYFTYDDLARNSAGPGDADLLPHFCATRSDYEAQYAQVRGEREIGEVSPSYFYYADASRRIRDELGTPKIILLLRDPVQKAFSQYMHLVRDNRERLSFYQGLMAEPKRIEQRWGALWRYAEGSIYAWRIRRYLETFGEDRVKILFFEDLVRDAGSLVREVLRFLALDDAVCIDTSEVYNASSLPRSRFLAGLVAKQSPLAAAARAALPSAIRIRITAVLRRLNAGGKGEIDEGSRAYLRDYFATDLKEVEQILGRRPSWLV